MISQGTTPAARADVGLRQSQFYVSLNFGGSPLTYDVGDDVNLHPGNLNDKFKSVSIGSAAKVLAWKHDSGVGNYTVLTGKNPDISAIGGLSRFKVLLHDTRIIAFKFKDATGGAAKRYSLKIDAADVGQRLLHSNEDNEFKLVGTLPVKGPSVSTALYLRDEQTGAYLATGSVLFQWNAGTQQVDIVSQENFPAQLRHERQDASRFIITLTSNKPAP
jgi:hypothetical protein